MSLTIESILAALESHAASLGRFERVNLHEPKNAPGKGLTTAIWSQAIEPHLRGSGLSASSARIEFTQRIYSDMLAEPQDAIDPEVISATDVVMADLSGDFTLGGLIESVDLLGRAGTPLKAQAGYLRMDSGKIYRVMDITIPLLVNDLWTQVA